MIGGVETYTRLLAQGLGERSDYDVTVATAAQGSSTLPGMMARIVRAPTLPELWNMIRRSDIVLLAGPALVPLALALLSRRPVFIEHHGYQACCPNGLLFFEPEQSVCPERYLHGDFLSCLRCNWKTMGPVSSIARLIGTWVRRWMCLYASGNICVSQHVSKKVNLPRSQVIYHGLPTDQSEKGHYSATKREGPIVFGYVGRITGVKGVSVLLHAASILKKEGRMFALRIVGDGPDRVEIEGLARRLELGDRLVVTGFLNGARLREALEDISVLVMPSIWEETAGLAAMEQMIRGRMVIAADIGGLSEVVGDAGLKFQPSNIAGLAERMRQILNNPAFLEMLGRRAGERASQLFRQKQMIESHTRAFNAANERRSC
jgi:glycosyltransferase involved in cell wall biosynthesis